MNDTNNPLNEYSNLPRPELREEAFRRYEVYLARAQREASFLTAPEIHDPKRPDSLILLKPTTFIARCRDAIKGFQTYKYTSQIVRQPYNWGLVSIVQTTHGLIRFHNNALLEQQYAQTQKQYIAQENEIRADLGEKPLKQEEELILPNEPEQTTYRIEEFLRKEQEQKALIDSLYGPERKPKNDEK